MLAREWLREYCNQTIKNTKYRCTKHRQACQRCLDMLNKAEDEDNYYYFNDVKAERVVKFFTKLYHSKGVIAGQPIILDGLAKFVAYNLYGFLRRESDYRVFNKAFISMSRKGMKSQLQAGFALYDMSVLAVEFNTMNPCYCAGVTRDQSNLIFEECELMLQKSPLKKRFKITKDKIVHIKTKSFLKPLSKEAKKSGEGTNPHLGIIDEYKDHPDIKFYEVFETGMKAQPQPLLIMISTAGDNLNCPMFTQEYPYVERLLNGTIQNDKYFGVVCEVEKGDDIEDWRVWEKANQLLFTYKQGIEGLKDGYEIAKEIPEKMLTFKTKNLNIWIHGQKDGYMNMDKWKECEVKNIPIDIKNYAVWVGFDISSKIDLTSVAFIIPYLNDEGIKQYIIFSHSFAPNYQKVAERTGLDKVPYTAWESQGFLSVGDREIVDQLQVWQYVKDFCEENELDIEGLCFDDTNASLLMQICEDEGYRVYDVAQTHNSLNEATCNFREEVYEKNICYTKNPLLNFAMSNAMITKNKGQKIKIDKDATKKKVDAVDAIMVAFKLAMYYEVEQVFDTDAWLDSDEF